MELKKEQRKVLIIALILVVFGIYMVFSASSIWSKFKFNDEFYYLKKQAIYGVLGIISMFVVSRLKKNVVEKYAFRFLLFSYLLLILVLIPGIGIVRGGSRSWIGIGSYVVQPAEIFKLALIIYGAVKLSKDYASTKYFFKGIVPLLVLSVLGFGLIMLQPDFGSGVVTIASLLVMTMVSKVKLSNYMKIGMLGGVAFAVLVISAPYRLARITSFIDPWSDPLGSGFQIIQSLYALGPGGLLGLGVASSIQKHFYLPEPQTDFIFAIICEEFGFIGGIIIILLFAYLIISGLTIAMKSKNNFGAFLGVGITATIGIQVIINLSVVVGLMPVTGITLPFISYGGSSLIVVLMSVGLIINKNIMGELD